MNIAKQIANATEKLTRQEKAAQETRELIALLKAAEARPLEPTPIEAEAAKTTTRSK